MLTDRFFKIPNYQRPYSWKEEQLKRFLLDLEEYKSGYYLGHFLFEGITEGRFNIIDGQQRLTTIMLFLKSLYEVNNSLPNQDIYFNVKAKLEVVEYDNEVYKKLTTANGINSTMKDNLTSLSQNRMIDAKNLFLKELVKEEHIAKLSNYLDTIETAKISCSIFNDKIIANQVFMFSNARGNPLSDLDLLKSFLINLLNKANKSNESTLKEDIKNIVERPFTEIIKSASKISTYTFSPNEGQILN